ncbi:PilZ domain-containing protein [Hydrogenispora ethanolica]|uniref:PilZ domain-containing protein n=1 Tax=Hydrogenispora ethanolica TaxID=1082276 RepID=A0A4R1R8N2_HYDET|nr:PilZ domain-containing protein [Hydrogenispora ethanolica]TCL62021.1 PilZ domain-containing protein [Hydrogenispora ethanolica]
MLHPWIERRDFRIPARLIVRVVLGDGRSLLGKAEDLSLGGMKLRLHERCPPDTGLTVLLNPPGAALRLAAVSRWTLPADIQLREYFCGIRFAPLDPEQYRRLRAFVFEQSRPWVERRDGEIFSGN